MGAQMARTDARGIFWVALAGAAVFWLLTRARAPASAQPVLLAPPQGLPEAAPSAEFPEGLQGWRWRR